METGTFYPDRYHIPVCLLFFSANYTIDQPGRFLFDKFQEEAIASSCLYSYAHGLRTHARPSTWPVTIRPVLIVIVMPIPDTYDADDRK